MTEKKTAEEILHEHIDKESMDELSVNVWPDMLEAMEAYAAQQSKMPTKEMIEQYFNNHFDCYTDVTLDEYDTTEQAMTKDAVLKLIEWLRNQIEKR